MAPVDVELVRKGGKKNQIKGSRERHGVNAEEEISTRTSDLTAERRLTEHTSSHQQAKGGRESRCCKKKIRFDQSRHEPESLAEREARRGKAYSAERGKRKDAASELGPRGQGEYCE